jgi:hypothetical protein
LLILRALWAAWKRVGRAIGNVQARVLLTIVYVVVLAPFALIVRRRAEPPAASLWRERADPSHSLDAARRQF